METAENLSWLIIVLSVAVVVGLFLAYQTYISAHQIGESIYVRVLRSEYITSPPFSLGLGEKGLYDVRMPGNHRGECGSGGYIVDLRIGNMGEGPIVEIRFRSMGFGRGQFYLISGENITDGYVLEDPLQPGQSMEVSLFIPSDYVPSGKILLITATFSNGRDVTKSVQVP